MASSFFINAPIRARVEGTFLHKKNNWARIRAFIKKQISKWLVKIRYKRLSHHFDEWINVDSYRLAIRGAYGASRSQLKAGKWTVQFLPEPMSSTQCVVWDNTLLIAGSYLEKECYILDNGKWKEFSDLPFRPTLNFPYVCLTGESLFAFHHALYGTF